MVCILKRQYQISVDADEWPGGDLDEHVNLLPKELDSPYVSCSACPNPMRDHGYIGNIRGQHAIVCPGDTIIDTLDGIKVVRKRNKSKRLKRSQAQ